MGINIKNAIKTISQLTPDEVAVLWLSGDTFVYNAVEYEANVSVTTDEVHLTLPIPLKDDKTTLYLYNKDTLTIGCLFAFIYDYYSGDIDQIEFKKAISLFASELVSLKEEQSLEFSSNIPLAIQISKLIESIRRVTGRDVSISEKDIFYNCLEAMTSLQNKGLIIDPPWRKLAAGFLIVLAGTVPTDFSERTELGANIVHTCEIEAPFWKYDSKGSNVSSEWHFKLQIAEFVTENIEHMVGKLIEEWIKYHPEVREKPTKIRGKKLSYKRKKSKGQK